LFGRSSLPFARLQTLLTLKTLQIPRGSFHQALWPSTFAVPALACPLPAHSPLLLGRSSLPFASLQTLPFASLQTLNILRWGIRLPHFKHLKLLKPSRSLAAASTKPSGRQPLLFQGCSLPFACT